MTDIQILEQWARYLSDHPYEMQRICDRIYELFTEEVWNYRERVGGWNHRL